MRTSDCIICSFVFLFLVPPLTPCLGQGLPPELIKPPSAISLIAPVRRTNKRVSYDWNYQNREVKITRRERPSTNQPWTTQTQTISASFSIVDVRSTLNNSNDDLAFLYVMGMYEGPSPQTTIEKWKFMNFQSQTSPTVPPGPAPNPGVNRTVLYLGSQYSPMRSFEVHSNGQYILFLTDQNPTLYKLATQANPPPPTPLLDGTNLQDINDMGTVQFLHHVTEGMQFQLIPGQRWSTNASDRRTIVVPAGNLSTFELLDDAAMVARGYYDYDSWLYPARDY